MLHQELKDTTTPSHQALEKKMVGFIRNIKTERDYVRFLRVMYGYYSALERQIETFIPEPEILGRRKANHLLNDLGCFESEDEPALCRELPNINSYHAALGALYVMEGSTMGGNIIARIIKGQLGSTGGDGFSFFNGYGDNTKKMWEAFRQNFEKPFASEEREELIEAANNTFITFHNWISKHADPKL
jgi:heme oxygenase